MFAQLTIQMTIYYLPKHGPIKSKYLIFKHSDVWYNSQFTACHSLIYHLYPQPPNFNLLLRKKCRILQ